MKAVHLERRERLINAGLKISKCERSVRDPEKRDILDFTEVEKKGEKIQCSGYSLLILRLSWMHGVHTMKHNAVWYTCEPLESSSIGRRHSPKIRWNGAREKRRHEGAFYLLKTSSDLLMCASWYLIPTRREPHFTWHKDVLSRSGGPNWCWGWHGWQRIRHL